MIGDPTSKHFQKLEQLLASSPWQKTLTRRAKRECRNGLEDGAACRKAVEDTLRAIDETLANIGQAGGR